MLLSGKSVSKLIAAGEIKVDPPSEINETSIKIHLSNNFDHLLAPKEFIVAKSLEKISLSEKYAGFYDGYAGITSQGLTTHLGSMLIQPGFSGHITLEIFNASDKPITLKKGMRMGNLLILEIK